MNIGSQGTTAEPFQNGETKFQGVFEKIVFLMPIIPPLTLKALKIINFHGTPLIYERYVPSKP